MNFLDASKEIGKVLSKMPTAWDGRNSILEMKNVGFSHWKQMEWIGFIFNFYARNV